MDLWEIRKFWSCPDIEPTYLHDVNKHQSLFLAQNEASNVFLLENDNILLERKSVSLPVKTVS